MNNSHTESPSRTRISGDIWESEWNAAAFVLRPHSLLFLILPLLAGCEEPMAASARREPTSVSCSVGKEGPYPVAHVSDADTIVVRIPGRKPVTVRLLGVDAPEVDGPYRSAEPGGVEAQQFVRAMLEDQSVYLESDPAQDSHDRYGRRLAYVHRASDCTSANGEIIRQGYGRNYRRFQFRDRELYDRYEREARMHRRGMWH